MPRIRYIKPEFFHDEDIASLDYITRLVFIGLWCWADKAGRLEDRPQYLNSMIFPYEKVDFEKCLEQLSTKIKTKSQNPFIIRYEINGRKYIEIVAFMKHQATHNSEKPSVIPSFNGALTVKYPLDNDQRLRLRIETETEKGEKSIGGKKKLLPQNEAGKDVKNALSHFGIRFKEKNGETYFCTFKKDTPLIKNVIKLYGIEKTNSLIDKFFLSEDEFIKKSGHTIGIFVTQINKLLQVQEEEKWKKV